MKNLTPIEIRILGSLIEKELSTPEYYPMSANALTNACNQKNNRDPITQYDEITITNELESMKEKLLVGKVLGVGSRVPKYRHLFGQSFELYEAEVPILAVLMLRGPQTLGELRARTSSMKEYASLEIVDEIINRLMERDEPLVVRLPKQIGQKDFRFMHLLGGEPDLSLYQTHEKEQDLTVETRKKLEEQIDELKQEINLLKSQFEEFRKQFE